MGPLKREIQSTVTAADSCDGGISVLNHCLSWSKFVNTHLFYFSHWFNIQSIYRVYCIPPFGVGAGVVVGDSVPAVDGIAVVMSTTHTSHACTFIISSHLLLFKSSCQTQLCTKFIKVYSTTHIGLARIKYSAYM